MIRSRLAVPSRTNRLRVPSRSRLGGPSRRSPACLADVRPGSASSDLAAWIGPSHGSDGRRLGRLPNDRCSTGRPDSTAPPNTHRDKGGASSSRRATDTDR